MYYYKMYILEKTYERFKLCNITIVTIQIRAGLSILFLIKITIHNKICNYTNICDVAFRTFVCYILGQTYTHTPYTNLPSEQLPGFLNIPRVLSM